MKTKAIHKLAFTSLILLCAVTLQAHSHFVPDFVGNGTDHMNIKIISATLSGLSLIEGDEIAVYDGSVCCGVVVLTEEIVKTNPSSFGLIAASRADNGNNNGYTPGNSIQFKVWDQSESTEYQNIRTVYYDPLTGLPTTAKNFTVNGSAFVGIQVNFRPTANAGPNQTVNENARVFLNGTQSSDPENDELSYHWTAPEGIILLNANTATPEFTAPEITKDTSYCFVLTVNDGLLDSQPDTVVVSLINVFDPTTHFQTVWSGNGTDHMNVFVVSALLDGIHLEAGDEVALFDGPLCVGAKKLIRTIDAENTLQIVASLNSGDGLGYTPGDSIFIRVYDHSANKETDIVQVSYYNHNMNWSTSGLYEIGASSFISIEALTRIEQVLIFQAGWNMKSFRVIPDNKNLFDIFQPLAEAGNLRKVMDEQGLAIEHWGVFGGWHNSIGDFSPVEGYKIYVNRDTSYIVSGPQLTLPINIGLTAGWNIIPWPATTAQDAWLFFQQLAYDGLLVKVMDEVGNSLEYWGEELNWINHIGDLKPGVAYHVKVIADCSITISENLFRAATSINPSLSSSLYFSPAYEGNGTDHMNINILDLKQSGLLANDEIGIFDAEVCVGSARISEEDIQSGYLSLKAAGNSDLFEWPDGFSKGHPISLYVYRDQKLSLLNISPEEGAEACFEVGASLFGRLAFAETGLKSEQDVIASALPNPFVETITLRFQHQGDEILTVALYDLGGKLVKQLFQGKVKGQYEIVWDGLCADDTPAPAGIYVCKINHKAIKLIKAGN